MAWLLVLLSVALGWALWTCISLLNNYIRARQIGLPIIISPISALNPVCILATKAFPSLPKHLSSLPFGLGTCFRVSYIGWMFPDKCAMHERLGDAFTVVNPSFNEVFIADADAAHTILAKRKEFIKPAMMYGV